MRFLDGPDVALAVRDVFDDAGYTLDALTERLGPQAFNHLSSGEFAPLLRATRGADRLDVLARLFLIGEPVTVSAARAALAPVAVEQWAAGGLLSVRDDEIEGLVAIRPLGEPGHRLVVHDRPDRSGAVRADHVLGISASTMALAGATIRRPIESALDLGTGCGIQGVLAADHSRRVVATDVNPRALACATLTMELNDLAAVTVRGGDRFDAVGGERFDLIVSNPPFVVSPSRRYVFRDSGLPLDDLSRSIVRAAPDHLEIGGYCQLLASWAHVRGEDWRARVAGWFEGTGCDALVLEREALDPAAHAASWLRQGGPDQWSEFDAWIDDAEAHDLEAIGFGLITMRRRQHGVPWFRAETAEQDFAMPCGDHLGALFELAAFLERHDDGSLLDVTVRAAPDVLLDEHRRASGDGWEVAARRLRQTAGLRTEGDVDPAIASFVLACDGRRPLRQVLAGVADDLDLGADELASAAVPVIRRMIEQAILLPVGGP
ncbi:MAG: DUF7059 domain-containing protein [Ilumatobacteraceae bacterium]